MSLAISRRVNNVQPSATMAVTQLAARLREQGRDIIPFAAGEPDFDTPEFICEAAIAAIRDGMTRYTAVDGIRELREAVANKFERDNGLAYGADATIVASGAKQLCYNLCQAVLDEGDEAIVPAPYWVSYPEMVRLAGAKPVVATTSPASGFKLTPEALRAVLTPKTKLLFMNSPGNPTGCVYTREELQGLGDVLQEHPQIVVGSDEIYEHIYWGKDPYVSFAAACPSLRDRVLTINGVSKCYAMTGWRIGYAGGPRALIAALSKLQGQSTTNACAVSQYAALAALNGDQGIVAKFADTFHKRHDRVTAVLNRIESVRFSPAAGAFYAFPDVSSAIHAKGLLDETDFCMQLLEQTGVALVPGGAFGAPGHVRLSYSCADAQLDDGLARFAAFTGSAHDGAA